MGRVITIANQKGGVGKTTTTVSLGAALGEAGKRVLLIDLDPQGNLTKSLGYDPNEQQLTIWSAIDASLHKKEGPSLQESIVTSEENGVDLVPGNLELSQADLDLVSAMNRERRLLRLLEPCRDEYDYILIDCPPYLGLLTVNALTAANEVIIPLQAEWLAMNGVSLLFRTISEVQTELNRQLKITGVLMTMVDKRTSHSKQVVEATRSGLAGQVPVFETEIGENSALKEAPITGKNILLYAPRSQGAQGYRALAKELINSH